MGNAQIGSLRATSRLDVPETAESLTEAVALARDFLSDRLEIPEASLRDLKELDAERTSRAWGAMAYRAFRALRDYAEDQAADVNRGSFYDWCQRSGSPFAVAGKSKHLAIREFKTVESNDRLRELRRLPVSVDVDPTGRILMFAHIKIATGGGNMTPRIYFHWTPDTCRVHIGFFGPHKYMPNTKT